jgi:hypothetical protein
MEDIYYRKYLKYKTKYLELLNSQEGGGKLTYKVLHNDGKIIVKDNLYTNQFMWISILYYLNNYYKPNKLNVSIRQLRNIASSNGTNMLNPSNKIFDSRYHDESLLSVLNNYKLVVKIYNATPEDYNYIFDKPKILPENFSTDNPNIISIVNYGWGQYGLITEIDGIKLYEPDNEPGKQPGKQPYKKQDKQPYKQPYKQPVDQPVEQVTKQPVEQVTKQPYKQIYKVETDKVKTDKVKTDKEVEEDKGEIISYKKTTTINDYKKIIWYKNSCYFSVAMWFLWTLIPFREFISNYSGDNNGFIAIKELFDQFNDNSKSQPINIELIYQRVFLAFVKRNISGREVKFGEQDTSAYLIEKILEKTENDEFLNKISLTETVITKCEDDKSPNIENNLLISTSTVDTNIFIEQKEILKESEALKRCKEKDSNDYGSRITKIDLVNDTNQYFILQFTEEKKYTDVQEIKHNGKIFKIKSVVSYLGETTKLGGMSGHYCCYVFDDNGENTFVLDDMNSTRDYYMGKLNDILINSIVLYKLVDDESSVQEVDRNLQVYNEESLNDRNAQVNRNAQVYNEESLKKVNRNVKINRNAQVNRNVQESSEKKPIELSREACDNIDELINKLNDKKNKLEKKIQDNKSLLEKIKKSEETKQSEEETKQLDEETKQLDEETKHLEKRLESILNQINKFKDLKERCDKEIK